MMSFSQLENYLKTASHTWLVTGAAGFIGANITFKLLELNQKVFGLDNFSTGLKMNIEDINRLNNSKWRFVEADIANTYQYEKILAEVDFVIHQAAVGSVPRSIKEPLVSHASNVDGFIKILHTAKEQNIKKFVYASSSSVYGDEPNLPKVEERVGQPLSPYATTKKINEIYAAVYSRCYSFPTIGLRYFNVFGPRQDPNGPYAAVIPIWIKAALENEPIGINGDGSFSRDFCYIDNVVQANLMAAFSGSSSNGEVFNVAYGTRTTLNDLAKMIIEKTEKISSQKYSSQIFYRPYRAGDIPHSLANIEKATRILNYVPFFSADNGLDKTIQFFIERQKG